MTATATRTRPNAYAGTCRSCGGSVAAQAGILGPRVAGRWTVEHTTCPSTPVAVPARRTVRRNQPSIERCFYGHRAPVSGCGSCFDDFS
jgi:hypothetical protein